MLQGFHKLWAAIWVYYTIALLYYRLYRL